MMKSIDLVYLSIRLSKAEKTTTYCSFHETAMQERSLR